MRTLSLLIISMFLVTGCGGSGGGSEGSATSGSGTIISNGDTGGSPNSGSQDDGSFGGVAGDDGTNDSNGGATIPEPTPEPTPPPPSNEFADQMLYAVNLARSEARSCGGEMMPAVDPLTWDYSLEQAAYGHTSDMANGGFMSHTGSDGSQPSERVSATGYNWRTTGENVAAGQKDIDAVMTAWLNSAGHCKNIMSANYTQMGAASVSNSSTRYGIYWTQVFARPR